MIAVGTLMPLCGSGAEVPPFLEKTKNGEAWNPMPTFFGGYVAFRGLSIMFPELTGRA